MKILRQGLTNENILALAKNVKHDKHGSSHYYWFGVIY